MPRNGVEKRAGRVRKFGVWWKGRGRGELSEFDALGTSLERNRVEVEIVGPMTCICVQ